MTAPVLPLRRPGRRWLRVVVFAGLAGLAVLGTSPAWFPWVVRAVAGGFGFRVGEIDRRGWARVRFHDVAGEWSGAAIRAGVVEVPQPLAWLVRGLGYRPDSPEPVVRITDWTAAWGGGEGAAETGARSGAPAPADVLEGVEAGLKGLRWVTGPVEMTRGRVTGPSVDLAVPGVLLDAAGARVAVATEAWQGTAVLRVGAGGDDGLRLAGALAPWGIGLDLRARRSASAWSVEATLNESTNRVHLTALLAPGASLPERATLRAAGFRLPLPAAFPGTVLADLHADWVEGAGTGAVHLEGETRYPADARGVAVAGDIAWRFTGEGGRLETFRIESEPVRVWLDRPVELGWREPRRLPPAVLGLDLRLEELTGGRLRGGVAGTLTAEETGAGQPRVRFALLGSDLGTPGRPPGAAEVEGVLDRTDLQVTRLLARLPGGGEFRAQGDVDLAGATVRRGAWTFEGLLPFVVGPTNGGMPGWVASGEVRGSYTNLVHAAAVRTVSPLKLPGWQPLDLRANWSGRGGDVDDLEVVCGPTGSAAYLRLRASGRFRPEPAEASVRLRFLEVGDGPSVMLALKEPAAVVLRRAEGVRGGRAAMELRVEPLRLAGAAGEWGIGGEVEWPTRGRFEWATRAGVTGWMAGWREGPPASWAAVRVGSLDVRGHWDGGPLAGEFAFDLEGPVAEVGPVRATGRGGFGAAGVELGEVRFGHLGQGAVTFSGFVPVVAVPGGEGEKWRLLREAAPRGELRAAADAWVWDWLAARTGVRGSGPDLQVSLGGTAGAPEARLELTVGRVPLPGPPSRAGADPEWPTVEAVSLHARATLDELVLDDLDVRVAGQHARLTGRLPWPDRPETGGFPDWSKWDWRRAEARLSVAHAELAPFLRLIPGAVQPSGSLGAEVTWAGGALGGWVEATGLASQPVERVGTVRDIAVRLAFLGDRVAVERGEARLGGQPVALSGWLALPGSAGSGPVGELWLRATNVAIVRTPGALLRADLDLGLVRTNPGVPPRIGGEVNLRDSVVMLDVRDLVGVDLERPERRPPYFGVDRAPLADWVLDLRVRGAQFARVLSPAFRGTVSADARLVGTLRSPRLLGEGLVDRGQIVFPFGQLQVGQARVRFTELRPFQPVLEGRAEGVNFGYTVSLEIQGTLDQPQVRFDSVPPLGTREVLQMLTAGNLPSREYTYSDATKAQQVGAFLAGDLVSSLTGDPSEEPRLSLRSGQRVSTSGRLTYGVEYRLGPRWSLVGEYDRWSQFGAGVRWRVLEK